MMETHSNDKKIVFVKGHVSHPVCMSMGRAIWDQFLTPMDPKSVPNRFQNGLGRALNEDGVRSSKNRAASVPGVQAEFRLA